MPAVWGSLARPVPAKCLVNRVTDIVTSEGPSACYAAGTMLCGLF